MSCTVCNITVVLMLSLIFVIGVIGNVLVAIAGMTWKGWRSDIEKSSNIFVVNLAIADLGILLLSLPSHLVVTYLSKWPFGDIFCRSVTPLREVFTCVSILGVTTIAIQRNMIMQGAVPEAFSYKTTKYFIAFLWISSYFIIGLPLAFVFEVQEEDGLSTCTAHWKTRTGRLVHQFFIVIFNTLPLVVTTVSYCRIAFIFKRLYIRRRRLENFQNDASQTSNESVSCQSQRFSTFLFLLVCSFWLCHVPSYVHAMVLNVKGATPDRRGDIVFSIITCLYFATSAVNPVFLMLVSRVYRRGVQSFLAEVYNDLKRCC